DGRQNAGSSLSGEPFHGIIRGAWYAAANRPSQDGSVLTGRCIMPPLTESDKNELLHFAETGGPLPEKWRRRLLGNRTIPEIGKEYRLVYDGKMKREEVLAETPAAPWQLDREFCTERPHSDGWRNLLVWGDNLLALRELLADQQGPDR